MTNTDLIELEFENKSKLPQEVKNKINTSILKNLIVAVIIMVYLLIINLTYYKASDLFEECLKYYSCAVVIASVVFFELAYNKKKLFFGVIGVELLVLRHYITIYTLCLFTYKFNSKKHNNIITSYTYSILCNKISCNFKKRKN